MELLFYIAALHHPITKHPPVDVYHGDIWRDYIRECCLQFRKMYTVTIVVAFHIKYPFPLLVEE